MGKYEIVGIALFVMIGLLFFVAESESISENAKRYIAMSCLALFVAGAGSFFLVDDQLGDWTKPTEEEANAPKKKKPKIKLDMDTGGAGLDDLIPVAVESGGGAKGNIADLAKGLAGGGAEGSEGDASSKSLTDVASAMAGGAPGSGGDAAGNGESGAPGATDAGATGNPDDAAKTPEGADSAINGSISMTGEVVEPQTLQDCPACPVMVILQPGSFTMGSTPKQIGHSATEGPQRSVKITRAIAIGRTEVSREQFEAFAVAAKYKSTQTCLINHTAQANYHYMRVGFRQDGKHPVACVSIKDANAYAAWLSRKTAQKYRLPTEAEWEYAARGGTESPFASGDKIGRLAVWGGTQGTRTVGTLPYNSFALHDMHGNVAEMVSDCWHDGFRGAPYDGRSWVDAGGCKLHVLKGGSWYDDALLLRSAARQPISATTADHGIGFRVVRELD